VALPSPPGTPPFVPQRRPHAFSSQVSIGTALPLTTIPPETGIATSRRLGRPIVSPCRITIEAGALISYGQNYAAYFRRSATYVDKIFKGAKPSELPIEQPTFVELIVNRKTAKTLGLTISQDLLLRADKVIE